MIQHDTFNGKYYHDGVEITETEYNNFLAEIIAKNEWADRIYSGIASIDDCPVEWREEVSEMVEIRKEEPDIDDSEALSILLGGAV